MFVENFDEMYARISDIRQWLIKNDAYNYEFMSEFNLQAIILIQDNIDRLRELGVPDDAMTFTVAELTVLSDIPDFDIKIRWVQSDGKTFTT